MSTELTTPDHEYSIIVRNVSKVFEVHADRRSTLKERVMRGAARQRSVFHALDDVSFSIKKGSTFGLIGHNGSGKSTMLKILAGVYQPSSGSVEVSAKVDALLELGAGFHGELSGRENIYLNGAILGRSRKEIDDTLEWIISYADIGDFIDEPVKVYSSGMTVRLGFAVAVAVRPEILIVDEIIAVGDEEFQRKCFDLMRQLRAQGTTIALVTHSLSLAQEMCDEVVWLDHGRVKEVGDASTVISSYIADVNARENAKRAAEESLDFDPDDEFNQNQGIGTCRMIGVEFLNKDLHPSPALLTGEAGTVRIHIRSAQALDNIEVGLSFVAGGTVGVAGPNSRHGGRSYSLPQGCSYVDYTMDPVLFLPGPYKLTVGIFGGDGTIYDFSNMRTDMRVHSSQVVEEPGLVALPPGMWSREPVVTTEEDHS
ncbi:ABC transporter ATP-binding protein [Schaalia sp. Marseille-Q2122]|uniref:ABC transporter ATP-binding protein n=1 Tax=Schaalia sp. Marseille-Q2122 TaxID=2736604 RepID=UPI00158F04DF|nr:ABC transporter ATP-binding protein [Schaalia sp. Marseille-Q2122]